MKNVNFFISIGIGIFQNAAMGTEPGRFCLESAAVKLEVLRFGGNLEAFSRISVGAGARVCYLFLFILVLFIVFGFFSGMREKVAASVLFYLKFGGNLPAEKSEFVSGMAEGNFENFFILTSTEATPREPGEKNHFYFSRNPPEKPHSGRFPGVEEKISKFYFNFYFNFHFILILVPKMKTAEISWSQDGKFPRLYFINDGKQGGW